MERRCLHTHISNDEEDESLFRTKRNKTCDQIKKKNAINILKNNSLGFLREVDDTYVHL